MNRKGFFGALLGGAAVPPVGELEPDDLLEGVRLVMRYELERMLNAPMVTTSTTSKRYSPEGKLEWVGEFRDDGVEMGVKWRRAKEDEV